MKKLFSILLLGACALAPAAARAGEAKAADPMKELQAAVNAKDKTAFIKALTDLGNEGTEKAAQMILNVALSLDSLAKFPPRDSNDIFDAAESALANVKDPKGEKLIYEDLKKDKGGESWKIRVFLCDVVAKKRTPEAEDALVAAVKDKNPTVQKTAISHLLLKKSKKAVEPVIEVLGKVEKKRQDPWIDCERFLALLTGNNELTSEREWKDWWAANKEKFDPNAVANAKRSSTGVGETISRNAPKLFGTEILSKKVVFVLDVSGSMQIRDPVQEVGKPRKESCGPKDAGYQEIPAERERLTRLREAMIKLIQDLPPDTRFTMFTFATNVRCFSTDLMEASAGNKEKAIDFAKGMVAEGYTVTDDALRQAFTINDANTIYLFSDGTPQRGKNADGTPQRIDPRDILEEVEQMNRVRKVKIFTIGIGEADTNFMTMLAAQNGGTFTPVQ